jgi:hypothetical protein
MKKPIARLLLLAVFSTNAFAELDFDNHIFGFHAERDKQVCHERIVKKYSKVMDHQNTQFHSNVDNLPATSQYIYAKANLLTLLKFIEADAVVAYEKVSGTIQV